MTTQAEILDALQFDMTFLSGPINTTGAPAYVFQYQFAGNSQPGDLWNTYTGWTALTAGEKNAVRAALDHIETFLNISFVEITGAADPDMNIGKVSLPGSTAGYGGYQYSAWSDGSLADYDSFVVYDNTIDLSQTRQMGLILHELGHALGLKHPFSGDTLPAAEENNKYTVMSYTANPDTGQDADALMLYDIFALQDRWGANTSHNSGDTLYTEPRNASVDPLWDGGGDDTLDGSGAGGNVRLDLRAGRFSRYGTYDDIVIPIGVVIENATGGAGQDTLTGNAAANILTGNGNGDLIFGGDGFDTLIGNGGNDTVWGGNGRDKAFLGDGNDRFEDNSQGGDFARDTVFGGGGNDTITGGAGNDRFYGGNGNDVIFGRTGNDVMTGGLNADTFVFEAGFGQDTITDFYVPADTLRLEDGLWGGGLTALQVVNTYASLVGGNAVFTFGSNTITLDGVNTLTDLDTALDLF